MAVRRAPIDADGRAVEIGRGRLVATVMGGALLSVTSLRCGDVELLADPSALPDPYRVHGCRAGITLLHPWANRLGRDTYSRAGANGRVDDSSGGIAREANGLAIHGLAIPGSWRVTPGSASSCMAAATFGALPAFPFPHTVDVRVSIDPPNTLTVVTTVRAAELQPVPIAFGWHPYFVCDRARGCAIELPERRRLELDARGLPTGVSSRPLAPERLTLTGQRFDDLFAGVIDGATLELDGGDRVVRVTHERGYPYTQVFAPADAPVVSLEPMTAATNALGSDEQIALAHPGQPFTARFSVEVSD